MALGNVLHQQVGPGTEWSRVNIAQVVPGVQTPLSWVFWDQMERAFRLAYGQLSLIPRAARDIPDRVDDQYTAIFYGRAATNIGLLQHTLSALPANARDAAGDGLFAWLGDNRSSATRWRRLIVRVKLPLCAFRVQRELAALRDDSHRYWTASLAVLPTERLAETVALLRDAIAAAAHEQATQIVVTTIILVRQGALRSLVRTLGRDDLSTVLMGGYGVSEEGRLAAALYEVARGRSSLEAFLDRYGFYGPAVGELSSRTWREDQSPVQSLLRSMASTPPDDPKAAEDRAVEARTKAQQELLAQRSAIRRWRIRRTLARADRFLPLRVVAKAAYTETIDVVRAAARTAGERLVAAGVIDDREDVFYLTLDELSDAHDLRTNVAERRALRLEYARYEIPMTGTGPPEPRPIDESVSQLVGATGPGTTITGLGASHGVAEGPRPRRARFPRGGGLRAGRHPRLPHDRSELDFALLDGERRRDRHRWHTQPRRDRRPRTRDSMCHQHLQRDAGLAERRPRPSRRRRRRSHRARLGRRARTCVTTQAVAIRPDG